MGKAIMKVSGSGVLPHGEIQTLPVAPLIKIKSGDFVSTDTTIAGGATIFDDHTIDFSSVDVVSLKGGKVVTCKFDSPDKMYMWVHNTYGDDISPSSDVQKLKMSGVPSEYSSQTIANAKALSEDEFVIPRVFYKSSNSSYDISFLVFKVDSQNHITMTETNILSNIINDNLVKWCIVLGRFFLLRTGNGKSSSSTYTSQGLAVVKITDGIVTFLNKLAPSQGVYEFDYEEVSSDTILLFYSNSYYTSSTNNFNKVGLVRFSESSASILTTVTPTTIYNEGTPIVKICKVSTNQFVGCFSSNYSFCVPITVSGNTLTFGTTVRVSQKQIIANSFDGLFMEQDGMLTSFSLESSSNTNQILVWRIPYPLVTDSATNQQLMCGHNGYFGIASVGDGRYILSSRNVVFQNKGSLQMCVAKLSNGMYVIGSGNAIDTMSDTTTATSEMVKMNDNTVLAITLNSQKKGFARILRKNANGYFEQIGNATQLDNNTLESNQTGRLQRINDTTAIFAPKKRVMVISIENDEITVGSALTITEESSYLGFDCAVSKTGTIACISVRFYNSKYFTNVRILSRNGLTLNVVSTVSIEASISSSASPNSSCCEFINENDLLIFNPLNSKSFFQVVSIVNNQVVGNHTTELNAQLSDYNSRILRIDDNTACILTNKINNSSTTSRIIKLRIDNGDIAEYNQLALNSSNCYGSVNPGIVVEGRYAILFYVNYYGASVQALIVDLYDEMKALEYPLICCTGIRSSSNCVSSVLLDNSNVLTMSKIYLSTLHEVGVHKFMSLNRFANDRIDGIATSSGEYPNNLKYIVPRKESI